MVPIIYHPAILARLAELEFYIDRLDFLFSLFCTIREADFLLSEFDKNKPIYCHP